MDGFKALGFDPHTMKSSQPAGGPPPSQDALLCLHKLSSMVSQLLQAFSRYRSPSSGLGPPDTVSPPPPPPFHPPLPCRHAAAFSMKELIRDACVVDTVSSGFAALRRSRLVVFPTLLCPGIKKKKKNLHMHMQCRFTPIAYQV